MPMATSFLVLVIIGQHLMGRYESNKILKYSGKPRQFKSNIYPPIPRSQDDIYLISRNGDRLDILAHKYYGDQTLWWVIAVANNLGKHGIIVPPAKQLRIPTDLSEILSAYRNLQGER